jgi:hypothetical protein
MANIFLASKVRLSDIYASVNIPINYGRIYTECCIREYTLPVKRARVLRFFPA